MLYKTNFTLTDNILNLKEANEYLHEDNMTNYLPEILKKVVKSIIWTLTSNNSGIIKIETSRELSEEELNLLKIFIIEQNSDGLGEGFSGQDFSNYLDTFTKEWKTVYFEWGISDITKEY